MDDRTSVDEAVDWLAEHTHENLGTEVVLRAVIAGDERWRVAMVRRADRLAGVSAWAPGGQWFLEADNEAAATVLAEAVQASEGAPVKVTTSGL
jgi:hypothetical protein